MSKLDRKIPLSLGLDFDGGAPEQKDAIIERYRRVLNRAVETAIITLDSEGLVTGWSEGARRMLGWSEEEMLGQSLERIFPKEGGGLQALMDEMRDARLRGGAFAEGWRVRKQGERFWAIGEVTPLDEVNPGAGFVKIIRDRTDRQLVELQLTEQARALELLNRTGASLARETNVDVLVQTVTDAGVALTGAQFGAFFYNVIDKKGESYMLYTLSGVPREAFSAFPMPRNTAIFAPTFGGDGIVRSADITKDPRYGRNAPHAGMPKGHLPVRSYLAVPVISRSGTVLGGLFFGHSEPGMFTEESERSLSGLAGEAAVAIDNVRLNEATQAEIAERRRAEAALRELNTDLEELVKRRTEELSQQSEALRQSQKMEAIGQLTGGIAHDFNNMLQVVVGNLEILNRSLPEDMVRQRRAVGLAMSGAKRAGALTRRLLAFARRQPLDPKAVNVNTIVQGMMDLLRRTLGETIELQMSASSDLWTVEADPNELENALLNLAVNARDAMPAGGKLSIEAANVELDEAYVSRHVDLLPGAYVEVRVSDTGQGMDTHTMSRAFDPYFTTKAEGKGTGLGLSQVYGFVKQSHGHVQLDSRPGAGTVVRLYLPRSNAEAVEMVERESGPAPLSARERVLVVEDDADVRTNTVEALQELGYQVTQAADGAAALSALQGSAVDLLFTDVVLPGGMTGAEIATHARGLRPGIKVLFTTGYARDAIVHDGRLDKGVQLITKPFTFDDLAVKVREVLDAAPEV